MINPEPPLYLGGSVSYLPLWGGGCRQRGVFIEGYFGYGFSFSVSHASASITVHELSAYPGHYQAWFYGESIFANGLTFPRSPPCILSLRMLFSNLSLAPVLVFTPTFHFPVFMFWHPCFHPPLLSLFLIKFATSFETHPNHHTCFFDSLYPVGTQ